MIRRPRAWRPMWIASSLKPLTVWDLCWRWWRSPDNDNATPVKALSLDVERWLVRQREAR